MSSPKPNSSSEAEFADDLLRGGDEISEFLFKTKIYRRRVYHLARTSKLPTFKLGSMLCARISVLKRFVKDQEERCIQRSDRSDAGADILAIGSRSQDTELQGQAQCSACGSVVQAQSLTRLLEP